MKEVYKRIEIIQAYSPEALIAHHNWLLDGLRKFNNDKEKLRKLIQNDMNKNPDKYDMWRKNYGVNKYKVLAYVHLLYNVSKHNVPPTNRKNIEKIARIGMFKTHPNKGGTNKAASQAAAAKNMLLIAYGYKSSSKNT